MPIKRTYIPDKHYKTFWKPRIYAAAYGGLSEFYLCHALLDLKNPPEFQSPVIRISSEGRCDG